MKIKWTEAATNYLQRHNKMQDPLRVLLAKQLIRAQKRVWDISKFTDRWQPKSMLEIGPGLGVVALILAKNYDMARVHLLDGDGTDPIQHDYQSDMKPWNDVRVAAELVRLNVPTVEVCSHFVAEPLTLETPVDMICSFKSWGVHYPVETYLALAHKSLTKGGLLIIDIREERGDGDKNKQVEAGGFKLFKQLDARVRAFERI